MNPLKEHYEKKIAPVLQKELDLKNMNDIPRIERVNINVGIGTYMASSSDYKPIFENIAKITGQKPIMVKAKKSVSNFKLREGQPNGITVTLRKDKMYDFLNKLINIVLPRVRDFRGLSDRSFDGNGNYSLGLSEHTLFPEIKLDDVVKTHGVQVTIVTSAKTNEHGKALLSKFNFPFKKVKDNTNK